MPTQKRQLKRRLLTTKPNLGKIYEKTVVQAALGGMFIGESVTGLLYNSALNSPTFFTVCGIGGLICGAAVVTLAYVGAK